jgi:hypothetical protein
VVIPACWLSGYGLLGAAGLHPLPLHYPSTTITVSVGVAGGTWQLPGDCDLPILADQALYAAKAAGRNRYVVANNLRPVMRARTETT